MAACYLFTAYPRFCDNPALFSQHLFVLSFWLATTLAIMYLTRNLLIRLHIRFVLLPAVIIPTASCFILYVIYTVQVIGDFCWDDTLSYGQILGFVPHLFDLADNFQIPRALIVAILLVPPMVMYSLFEKRARAMMVWHWAIRETIALMPVSRRRLIAAFSVLTWLIIAGAIATADTSLKGFFNFGLDPIVNFFKPKTTYFAMTRERAYWSKKDMLAERELRPRIAKTRNVFLFVVDTLRADHLPDYGYGRPLTSFLSDYLRKHNSRRIDMALSTGLDTLTGTMCLMNSKQPDAISAYDYSLADYFSDNGFRTYLILSGAHTWQLQHHAFGRKIDLFYDGSEHPGPLGPCHDRLVVNELANLRPDDGGFHFFYIHLCSVHPLGPVREKFLVYKPIRNIIIDNTPFLGDGNQDIVNLYDDRILQMDNVMKRVLGILGQKGYLKDFIAVITADHGQVLGEKGRYGHGHFANIEAMRIPMIFFGTNPKPLFPETRFASQIDIAPTLTDMAGLGFFPTWQGQSLLRPRTNPWTYHLSPYSHAGQEGAVVHYSPGQILKFSRKLEEKGGECLYDLSRDPREEDNLIGRFDKKFLDQIHAKANEHFTSY